MAPGGFGRIRRVDMTNKYMHTIAGTGTPGRGGDGQPLYDPTTHVINAQVDAPFAIAVDTSSWGGEAVYFTDTNVSAEPNVSDEMCRCHTRCHWHQCGLCGLQQA